MSKTAGSAKVYTRTGDHGKTSLLSGQRVAKCDPRMEAAGTVDELNSTLGVLLVEIRRDLASRKDLDDQQVALCAVVHATQHELFNIGSRLACDSPEILQTLPRVTAEQIAHLEGLMDLYSEQLAPLRNFILPGGCACAASAHMARTTCRRAERICVALGDAVERETIRYLNRLSDFLFVLARHLNRLMGETEPIWKPHAP